MVLHKVSGSQILKSNSSYNEAVPLHEPITLNYSRASDRRRKVICVTLLVLLSAIGWFFSQTVIDVVHQVRLLYLQRKCAANSLPADFVVYEEDPAQAAKLLARPNYQPVHCGFQSGLGWSPDTNALDAAGYSMPAFNSFLQHDESLHVNYTRFSPYRREPVSMVYVHEQTSRAGHHRLAIVTYAFDEIASVPARFLQCRFMSVSIIPAKLRQAPAFSPKTYEVSIINGIDHQLPNTRIFAGQPDPADPSHFTIRYQLWGQEDIIDGKLQDDDRVTLTPRNLPSEPEIQPQ